MKSTIISSGRLSGSGHEHKKNNVLLVSKTLILSMVLFLTLSCANNNNEIDFEPQTITPVLIGKGIHSGSAVQSNSVITNQKDWLQLMNSLTTENTSNFTETNIDFNNFQLLISVDSIRPDTGYSINISNVIENSTNITATITSINGGNGYTVLSQPFHIVKIPKSTKPVVFQ
jgi:hypothetical protein